MSKAFIASWRIGIVFGAITFGFTGIFARLVYLHILERPNLSRIVERNREKLEIRYANRGNVIDIRGNLLATSRTVVELGVDPQSFREEDRPRLPELARLLGMPEERLEQLVSGKNFQTGETYRKEVQAVRWRKLADKLSEGTYEKVTALGISGVYGNRKFDRIYPGGPLAAHLLGYVNREGTAVTGIERYMDFYLRGQDGWRETEHDGRRHELAQFRRRDVDPVDGYDVETSIDVVVQDIIEEELSAIVRAHRPKGASIIVSDPATGFIIGLANYPTFDLNTFWRFPIDAHRNRAVSDTFEPGSTFKIVAVSGALEESIVTAATKFDCGIPSVSYQGRTVSLPADHHPYGLLSVRDIVVRSSNRGASQVGILLGAGRLHDYAEAYGFGESCGFRLGGEVAGTLHPVRAWDRLTITRLPIGHAVSATPLQVHFGMSVIANQGVLMSPRVARRVLDRDGRTIVAFSPEAKRRVISTNTARVMAHLLTEVVGAGGTAPRAEIPGFQVAGKTGTTQKVVEGRYSTKHHVASFVGFFPSSRPRVVVSVVVDDPESGGVAYGGVVAAPAFKNVALKLIRYLGIEPPAESEGSFALKGGMFDSSY